MMGSRAGGPHGGKGRGNGDEARGYRSHQAQLAF